MDIPETKLPTEAGDLAIVAAAQDQWWAGLSTSQRQTVLDKARVTYPDVTEPWDWPAVAPDDDDDGAVVR